MPRSLPAPLAEALARACDAPAPYAPALATDADGTLWQGDVGDELFRDVASGPGFALGARALLAAALDAPPPDADDAALAESLYQRHHAGALDIQAFCDLEAAAVGDRALDALDALCDALALRFVDRVRPGVRALLEAAVERGLRVVVVTGSLDRVVRATLRRLDIPHDQLVGATLASAGPTALAALAHRAPVGPGKPAALCALEAFPPALALGDSYWDTPLLRAAHTPLLVHPSERLDAETRALSWRMIVHDPPAAG